MRGETSGPPTTTSATPSSAACVSGIYDQSGNGRNLLGASSVLLRVASVDGGAISTINSHPALFHSNEHGRDHISSTLHLSDIVTSTAFTIIASMRVVLFETTNQTELGLLADGGSGYFGSSTSINRGGSNIVASYVYFSGDKVVTQPAIIDTNYVVVTRLSGGTLSQWLNGGTPAQTTGSGPIGDLNYQTLTLGGPTCELRLLEVFVYNTALSNSDINALVTASGVINGNIAERAGVTWTNIGGVTPSGTLAVVEPPDTAVVTGGGISSGPLAVTEPADSASSSAVVEWRAALAASESTDTAAMVGTVRWEVILAAVESSDLAAFTGPGPVSGTLAASESRDTAVFAAGTGLVGLLTVSESADASSSAGVTSWLATLAAIDVPDSAAASGLVGRIGSLAASEAPDTAAVNGELGLIGSLAAVDQADTAAVTIQVFTGAVLDATDTPDRVLFTAAPVSIQEATGYILRSSQPRARVLQSANKRTRLLKYPVSRPPEVLNRRVRLLEVA
jgi:hypothetical protein